ncbi:ATP-binding protein [Paenalcaligenes sp.]|uniref:ATP-binding protein n=1 Tax=Paenalcaligenes sp. TaxID=1966342 RepID=UPI00262AEB8B|nr:ATP-binding protein [Paenalcaligenes sp.]
MLKKTLTKLSLTQRLLVGAMLWVFCSLLVAGALLNQLFQQHIEEQLHKELNMHMMQLIAQMTLDSAGQLGLSQALNDPRFEQPLSGLYWQIDVSSQPLLFSHSLWDETLTPPRSQINKETWFRYKDPELGELYVIGRSIALAEPSHVQRYQVWVAAQKSWIAEPLQRFVWMLVLTLAVLGCVLVVGVWWQLKLGLRPLRQLRQRLAAVHEGRANSIDGQYPQEIQPLVSEFNRVLRSQAQVTERARTQAGNLAHAIKTPLAVLANAAKKPDPQLAQLVLQQIHAAQEQVDYHLSRARVAAAVKTVGVRTEILPALHSLVKLLQRAYEPKSVQVELLSGQKELYFKGEAQDLHEILGNVLDNAFKWCETRVQVQVQRAEALGRPNALKITIDDDGKGIAASAYSRIFQRGVRADELAPGSGLGLAIVADLVLLYGGNIEAMRSPLGGLRIEIYFP